MAFVVTVWTEPPLVNIDKPGFVDPRSCQLYGSQNNRLTGLRSDLHDTTSDNRGRRVRDDWHVTTSWKTAWLKIRNMFRTGHGYTKGRDNYQVQHVTVSGDIPLDARKSKGKYIWPVEPLDTRKYEREMIEEDYLNYLVDRMG